MDGSGYPLYGGEDALHRECPLPEPGMVSEGDFSLFDKKLPVFKHYYSFSGQGDMGYSK